MNAYKSARLLSLFVLISGTTSFAADKRHASNGRRSPGAPAPTQLPPLKLKKCGKLDKSKSPNHHSPERSRSPLAAAAAAVVSSNNASAQYSVDNPPHAPRQQFRKKFAPSRLAGSDGNPLPEI